MKTRDLSIQAMLLAVAIILAYIEMMLPTLVPLPGIKAGLPNIAILICLYWLGRRKALTVSLLRILIIALFTGTWLGPGFYVSLTGALLALAILSALRDSRLTPIGLSVLGASFHNLGQLLAAAALLGTTQVLWLLPWFLLGSIPLGIVTGIPAQILRNRNIFPQKPDKIATISG